jgi:hypothetical protein
MAVVLYHIFATMTANSNLRQPTKMQSPKITPKTIKAPYSPEAYHGNKCLASGKGGSGSLNRTAMVTIMTEDYDVAEAEMQCPCGNGMCIVLTSRTDKHSDKIRE